MMVDEGLLTHASPNVKPFQEGGTVPEFVTKGADEQGTFGVPGGASVPRFTDKAAFGQGTTRLDSPGFAVMRKKTDEVAVPGSAQHPFHTKHYSQTQRPGYEHELIVPSGGETPALVTGPRLSGDSFAWTGKTRLYYDEALNAPGYLPRVGANIEGAVKRLIDPNRGRSSFGIRAASPEEVAQSRFGKSLDDGAAVLDDGARGLDDGAGGKSLTSEESDLVGRGLTADEAHYVSMTQQPDEAIRAAAQQGDTAAGEIVKAREAISDLLQREAAERTRDVAGRQLYSRRSSGLYAPRGARTPPVGVNGRAPETLADADVIRDPTDVIRDEADVIRDPADVRRDPADVRRDPTDVIRDEADVIRDPADVIRDPADVRRDPADVRPRPHRRDTRRGRRDTRPGRRETRPGRRHLAS